jgi:hypothetical protein
MSRQINARDAEEASVDNKAAPENELPKLRKHLSSTRQDQAETMLGVRKSECSDASQGLQEATPSEMAVQELPSDAAQETRLAEKRMLAVERQLHKHLPHGIRRNILCPYCGMWNMPESRTFCCELLRFAVVTVLVADRALKQASAAEKALQN